LESGLPYRNRDKIQFGSVFHSSLANGGTLFSLGLAIRGWNELRKIEVYRLPKY
jgi:hypothetical protein